jgi:shikimate dehydrogenase
LHGYWLETLGIDGVYVPMPVRPENLERVLRTLPAMGYAGVNLTIPHKEAALAIMDRIDPVAQRIGAVNTVLIADDGSLLGRNTDGFGFMENIRQAIPTFSARRGPAVVVGAGGAARAIIAALCDDGCPDIRLANRTFERAAELAGHFGAPVRAVAWQDREACLDEAALLVNATSLGMIGQPALDLALDRLPLDALVTDIVFVPQETDVLAAAKRRGNPVVDGLGMLIHQARPGFAAWFGVMPMVTPELRVLMEQP